MGNWRKSWMLLTCIGLVMAAAPSLAADREGARRDRPEGREAGGWVQEAAAAVDDKAPENADLPATGLPDRYKETADQLEVPEDVQKKMEEILRNEDQTRLQEEREVLEKEVEEAERSIMTRRDLEGRREMIIKATSGRKQLRQMRDDNYVQIQKQIMKLLPTVKAKEWPAAMMATDAVDSFQGMLTEEQTKAVYALMSKRAGRVNRVQSHADLREMRRQLIQHIYKEILTPAQRDELTPTERLAYKDGRPWNLEKKARKARNVQGEAKAADNAEQKGREGDAEAKAGPGDAAAGNEARRAEIAKALAKRLAENREKASQDQKQAERDKAADGDKAGEGDPPAKTDGAGGW